MMVLFRGKPEAIERSLRADFEEALSRLFSRLAAGRPERPDTSR